MSRRPPGAGGNSVVNSRALVLNAIFATRWPASIPRPSLAQIRAVLLADAAMTRAQRTREARVLGEDQPHVADWQAVVDNARKET